MESGFFEVEDTRMSNAPGYTESRLMPDPRDFNMSKCPGGGGRVGWSLLELTDA